MNLARRHFVLSALMLLLGFALPTTVLGLDSQAIVRIPILTTVETFPLLTSLLSSYIPYRPPPPSAPSFSSILGGVVRRARETRSWVDNKQRTASHMLCHTRPPYIGSPYAARAYYALFVVRLELCSQPSVIDSLPRPAWRLPSRRPPLTMPILPPPATHIDNSPTKTRADDTYTPAPPKPLYRPRMPSLTYDEDAEASPPFAVLEYTWSEDIHESLLPLWLECQAKTLDLWKRLRARKWPLESRSWNADFVLPAWEGCIGMASGFIAALIASYRFKRRFSRGLRGINRPGRWRILRYRLSPPTPPPLPAPSSPAPGFGLVLWPASVLWPPSTPQSSRSSLPHHLRPQSQPHTRIVECVYKVRVQGHRDDGLLFYRKHRTLITRGLPADWAMMERQAWEFIDRMVWKGEVRRPVRRIVQYDTRVVRETKTFDVYRRPDGTYQESEVPQEGDSNNQVFNSLEEVMANMPGCYRSHQWNSDRYWSAPDSPTPSPPQTPLLRDREPNLRRGSKVKIVEEQEAGEEGVDPDWEERVRRGAALGEI